MYVLPCPHVMTPSPLRRSRSYSPWYVHPEGSSESTGLDSTRGCIGVVNGGGGRASFLACFCRGVRACRAWYSDTEAAWLAGVRRMRPKPWRMPWCQMPSYTDPCWNWNTPAPWEHTHTLTNTMG